MITSIINPLSSFATIHFLDRQTDQHTHCRPVDGTSMNEECAAVDAVGSHTHTYTDQQKGQMTIALMLTIVIDSDLLTTNINHYILQQEAQLLLGWPTVLPQS